jgi:phage-related minor tail protein
VGATAPANRAPTITGTPATSATVGRTYSFQPVGSDADGNTLTYSIQNQPSWATFSSTTGRLRGTPTSSNVGTSARITITVSDGTATASLASFTIQVNAAANRAPTISGTPLLSLVVGTLYSFQPSASDADGNTLTFSITNKPAWATFNTSTGQLSGTPTLLDILSFPGIVISVSDGTAVASLPAFGITVLAFANGSATVGWSAPTENTDETPLNDLTMFKVVYGRSAGSLDQTLEVTNASATSATVNNLAPGLWFFAVRALNAQGIESADSNVETKLVL